MWSKTLVAIFLAFPAALALTGAVALLAPGSLEAHTLPVLLLFVPAWVAAASLTFLARSGRRAAGWMLLACLLGFGAQFLARSLHWVVLPT